MVENFLKQHLRLYESHDHTPCSLKSRIELCYIIVRYTLGINLLIVYCCTIYSTHYSGVGEIHNTTDLMCCDLPTEAYERL